MQKGVSNNNRPNSTGKGRRKSSYLWLSINSHHSTVTVREGAGRPSQKRTGGSSVYRNSVLPPAKQRVTRASTGVMKVDRVGSVAGQALGPCESVCGNLSQETGTRWGCPSDVPEEDTQDISPSSAPPSDKWHTGLGPGSFLVTCAAFLAR